MMSDRSGKFLILDGNAILHRAFHALPPLTSKKGEQVQGVYGFLLVLLRTLKEFSPTHMASAFDLKAPTFRHDLLEEYKAHRPPTPPSLASQIPLVKEALESFSVLVFEHEGFEADDIIATMAKSAEDRGEVVIVTGDTDLLQLVRPSVKVYLLRRGVKDVVVYDEESVRERYGFSPRQLVDMKALRGDPSDNVPGVPGIGEKRARELIGKFSSVESLLESARKDAEDISPKVRSLLRNHEKEALLAKSLVEVNERVPMEFDLNTCALPAFPREKAEQFLKRMGFSSFLKRIPEIEKYYRGGGGGEKESGNATLL